MHTPPELLRAAAIAALPAQTKTHLLNPNAVRSAKALGAATGLKHLGIHLMTVQPGHAATEYHRHHYEEQCFYVLAGRGEVWIDEQPYAVGVGDFVGLPARGAAHTLLNTGSEPLVFLAARQMLAQDVCDYPRQRQRLYMDGNEEVLVAYEQIRPPPG
ncbi:MAG: cupin domain-containing protein [Inhella sp.]